MKVTEPAAAYPSDSSHLRGLKSRLMASIDVSEDVDKLERCLEVMGDNAMLCTYTDEEFSKVLIDSEASGNASEEEVQVFFAKWGH